MDVAPDHDEEQLPMVEDLVPSGTWGGSSSTSPPVTLNNYGVVGGAPSTGYRGGDQQQEGPHVNLQQEQAYYNPNHSGGVQQQQNHAQKDTRDRPPPALVDHRSSYNQPQQHAGGTHMHQQVSTAYKTTTVKKNGKGKQESHPVQQHSTGVPQHQQRSSKNTTQQQTRHDPQGSHSTTLALNNHLAQIPQHHASSGGAAAPAVSQAPLPPAVDDPVSQTVPKQHRIRPQLRANRGKLDSWAELSKASPTVPPEVEDCTTTHDHDEEHATTAHQHRGEEQAGQHRSESISLSEKDQILFREIAGAAVEDPSGPGVPVRGTGARPDPAACGAGVTPAPHAAGSGNRATPAPHVAVASSSLELEEHKPRTVVQHKRPVEREVDHDHVRGGATSEKDLLPVSRGAGSKTERRLSTEEIARAAIARAATEKKEGVLAHPAPEKDFPPLSSGEMTASQARRERRRKSKEKWQKTGETSEQTWSSSSSGGQPSPADNVVEGSAALSRKEDISKSKEHDLKAPEAETKVGAGTGWHIRIGPVSDRFQTSFRPVSDHCHVGCSTVHVTVSFRLHSPCDRVMSDAQSCRMHSVISDMHLS